MLVVDASVAVAAGGAEDGVAVLGDAELVAPAHMWSEARSALDELAWRGELDSADAETMRDRIDACPVRSLLDDRLGVEAWAVAEELGWAKTCDAEYVALARILGAPVVTLDARLRRGASRLVRVVGPTEL